MTRTVGNRRGSSRVGIMLPLNVLPKGMQFPRAVQPRASLACCSECSAAKLRPRAPSLNTTQNLNIDLKESMSEVVQELETFKLTVMRRLDCNEALLRQLVEGQITQRTSEDTDNMRPDRRAQAIGREDLAQVAATTLSGFRANGIGRARENVTSSLQSGVPMASGSVHACACNTTGLLNISVHEQSAPFVHAATLEWAQRDVNPDSYIPEERLARLLDPDSFSLPPLPRGVIHPDSHWDLFMVMLLCYVAVSVPLVICFIEKQSILHAMIDLVVDAFFIVDILFNFRTAFFNSSRSLCTDLALIRSRYLHSWFIADTVSSIPVQIIFLVADSASDFIVFKMIRLVKIVRLSRIGRIKSLRDLQYNGVLHPAAVQLTKLLFLYFFVLHMVACFYWYVAVNSLEPESESPDCEDFVREQGRIAVWAMCVNLTNTELDRQYARAFYSAVLMMLGGDTYPTSPGEEIFTSCVMLLGIFTTSVIIGSCASLVASMNKQAASKQDHFDRLNSKLSYHKVSKNVKHRVRAFIEYLYASGNMNSEDLYAFLPQSIQTALEMEKKRPLIQAVDIFKHVSPACTMAVVHALQQVFVPPREYILVQGQFGYCMYFISRGVVQVTLVQHNVEKPLMQLSDGAHFGEGALVGDHHRNANVLTLTHCEMEKLDQGSFEAICSRHEELALVLARKAAERDEAAAKKKAEELKQASESRKSNKWKVGLGKLRSSSASQLDEDQERMSADTPLASTSILAAVRKSINRSRSSSSIVPEVDGTKQPVSGGGMQDRQAANAPESSESYVLGSSGASEASSSRLANKRLDVSEPSPPQGATHKGDTPAPSAIEVFPRQEDLTLLPDALDD